MAALRLKVDWYYLSFSEEEGWRGVCIVKAFDEVHALLVSHARKLNPGGEVVLFNLSSVGIDPPLDFRNRLMTTRDELREFDAAIGGEGQIIDREI